MLCFDEDRAMTLVMRLIWRWEGMVLTPYLCSAGVPTIGLGSTRYEDGTPVRLTDPPISRPQAEQLARAQIQRTFMRAVRAQCPGMLEPQRVAAVTSLVYNIGVGAFSASTLRKRINAEDYDGVPPQFMRWTRAGGRELRGLVARRAAEVAVWNSQEKR